MVERVGSPRLTEWYSTADIVDSHSVVGEPYPRYVLTADGVVATGDGTSAPTPNSGPSVAVPDPTGQDANLVPVTDGADAYQLVYIPTMRGAGSPVGAVTPLFRGVLYIDTTHGGLYQALGTNDTSWVGAGGNAEGVGDGSAPGVRVPSAGGSVTISGGDGVTLTDTAAQSGTGNGVFWSGDDGEQTFEIFLGATGEHSLTFGPDGVLKVDGVAVQMTP